MMIENVWNLRQMWPLSMSIGRIFCHKIQSLVVELWSFEIFKMAPRRLHFEKLTKKFTKKRAPSNNDLFNPQNQALDT